MSTAERYTTIGRLFSEHKEAVEKRIRIIERTREIAIALKKLADAINGRPDFDIISSDSVLQEYLDLSKIAALVIEERELTAKIEDYAKSLDSLGFVTNR